MKFLFALALAAVMVGCSKAPESESGTGSGAPVAAGNGKTAESPTTTTTTGGETPTPEAPVVKPTSDGADAQGRKPKDGDEVAVLDTNFGKIVFMFFPDVAPMHVANFKALARKGFYDGTKFHRVIPTFMIQGGDPNSKNDDRSDDGQGGSDKTVKGEFSQIDHRRGIVSMARAEDVDSASSQFFIVVQDSPFLNNKYSAFGKVLSGMDVADKIKDLPRDERDNPLPANPAIIKSVKIEKWPVK